MSGELMTVWDYDWVAYVQHFDIPKFSQHLSACVKENDRNCDHLET